MENVRTNKTLLGVINETAKQAVYGTAEVGSQLTQEAVPAAKCIIRTTGKVVHRTGEVLLRGTILWVIMLSRHNPLQKSARG